ncbi:unnamed protein product [Acanthocheilonema viteae]|uniref:Uncharacterized protein n=1 Tax=Acanthocheilonema viteae TaxID=6277 RepID=A0A498SU49_ACAVI|nr:unnamed protein product [Acanthocheilonema viteae]
MTNVINGYILYRLMVDRNNKSTDSRRHSLMPISEGQKSYVSQSPHKSLFEPFSLPVVQHIPIRQRLSSTGHDSLSADICSDLDQSLVVSSNPYFYRRRRMSLLQTLRYQNRLLADSGVECRSQQSDRGSETAKGHRSSFSSPFSSSVTKDSKGSSSIMKLRNKTFAFFGKRSSKRSQTIDDQISSDDCTKYCQTNENDQPIYSSIDLNAKEIRHGKSPSTNDSGHESQGRIVTDEEYQDDKSGDCCNKQQETVAVIEQSSGIHSETRLKIALYFVLFTLSCPQLGLNLPIYHEICRRAISNRQEFILIDDSDSEEDIEDSEAFMAIIEKSFVPDKKFKENKNDNTPINSLKNNSCDEMECIIEKDEIQYAAKLHRNYHLLENSQEKKNSTNEEFPFSQQYQQQHLRIPKKLQHLKLCNGYLIGQEYVSSKSERNSPTSRSSTETKKHDNEDERNLSMEAFLGKEILRYYPELDSLPSFYSDDEDDDNLSSLMLDHYLPPKYN